MPPLMTVFASTSMGTGVVDAWTKQQLPNTHYGDITLLRRHHEVGRLLRGWGRGGDPRLVESHRHLPGLAGALLRQPPPAGAPAMIRDDADQLQLGRGGAGEWMPSDNFSVQWIRTIDFKPGPLSLQRAPR